jgi:hypothetical protein
MVGSDILIKKKFLEYREFQCGQTYFSFFKVQKENSRREDTSNERNNNNMLKNRKLTNEIF